MKLILKGSIMVCLSLICGTININASDITAAPTDSSAPEKVKPDWFSRDAIVTADLLHGNQVIGHKELTIRIQPLFDWVWDTNDIDPKQDNPCGPIELIRNSNGTTVVKFHGQGGIPGKEIIFPTEDNTFHLDVAITKDKRIARIAEDECSETGLHTKREINYYNSCGTVLYTKHNTYGDKTGIDIYNFYNGFFPSESCEKKSFVSDNNHGVKEDENKANLSYIAGLVYSRYDGSGWMLANMSTFPAFKSIGKFPYKLPYIFSKEGKYGCILKTDKWLIDWDSPEVACLNLQQGDEQTIAIDGDLKDARVMDNGEVEVDYSSGKDSDMQPGKTYTLRFKLFKL